MMNKDIWRFDEQTFKVYVEDQDIKNEITSWDDCKVHCRYFFNKQPVAWDMIVPERHFERVAAMLDWDGETEDIL
jgi:hypothetical protein